ncbi:hypothetical protein RDV78_03250 [Bacillota bacterium LX-D]|nr:hypothetical protein [Bacillota bacterium LX-D]
MNTTLEKKIMLLQEFKDCTAKQIDLLEQDLPDEAIGLFTAKEELIQKIDVLELSVDEKLNPNLECIGKEITCLNATLGEKLQTAKKQLVSKLKTIHQQKKSHNVYTKYFTQTEGAFLDRKK